MQASTVVQIAQLKTEATSREAEAQMQASTVVQIAQLKTEATSREAEAQRKYDELQL
ncbi:hypothetical protein Gotur_006116 [Gossypium turneri]